MMHGILSNADTFVMFFTFSFRFFFLEIAR